MDWAGGDADPASVSAGALAVPALLGRLGLVWRRLERPVMRRQMGAVTRVGRTLAPAALAFLAVPQRQAKTFR